MTTVREPVDVTGGTEVLLRQIDRHLVGLRSGSRGAVTGLPVAASLRRLVVDTTQASAVDRAKVRVAVHYFVLRRDPVNGRGAAGSAAFLQVVNRILRELGRHDLVVRL